MRFSFAHSTRGGVTKTVTPPVFSERPPSQVCSGDLGALAELSARKAPEKAGKCRRCASRCHTPCEMMSMDSGMLPDWRVPTGKEPYMKEALEQVVELLR